MPAASVNRTKEQTSWPVPQLFPVWEGWAPVASEWQLWNDRFGAAYGAMSSEWMDFVRRRVAEDLAFQQDLAGCRCFSDVWRTYARFLETMANDYQSEMLKLSQLGGALAEAGAGSFGGRPPKDSAAAAA